MAFFLEVRPVPIVVSQTTVDWLEEREAPVEAILAAAKASPAK